MTTPDTVSPMPSKGTQIKCFRIKPELYDAAQAKAADHGVTLSDIVRQALQDYLDHGSSPKSE